MQIEVPIGWSSTVLGEALEKIVGGGTPSRNNPTFWNGTIPWASVKDLSAQVIENTQETITEEGLKSSSANLVPAGTVIMATRMAVGKTIRFTTQVAINQDLKALYPKDNMNVSFLNSWLQAHHMMIAEKASGSTVKGIRVSSLQTLPMLLPPLSEQRKIAAILSSVDEIIQATQAVIEQTRRVKEGLLQELLTKGIGHTRFKQTPIGEIPEGWEVKRLGLVFHHRKECGVPGLPTVSVTMDRGLVRRSEIERRTESALLPCEHSKVLPGDMVYNTMRMWQGASGVSKEECMVSPAYVVCVPDGEVDSEFSSFLFKSKLVIRKLHGYSQGLTGDRLRLYFHNFAAISLAFPPLGEQREIVAILSSHDSTISAGGNRLENLLRVKSGLLQDLLTGKVRVSA